MSKTLNRLRQMGTPSADGNGLLGASLWLSKTSIWFLGIVCLCLVELRYAHAETSSQIVIDTIVASVNGEPITLQEVTRRLEPPRELSLKEASQDPEVRHTLEQIIIERLIEEEARSKRITVTDNQVEEYVNRVAERNNLSRSAFEEALKSENNTIDAYRRQVKNELLRARLASAVLESSIGVSEEEISDYIGGHPELSENGSKVKLRQILVEKEGRGQEEIDAQLAAIDKGVESKQAFSALAEQYSDAPEAEDGGLLGVIAEEDLSPIIFDAIFSLGTGEVSKRVESPLGYHYFLVEERYGKSDDDDDDSSQAALREEVREILKEQKIETRMQTYFSAELYKRYSVDKKI